MSKFYSNIHHVKSRRKDQKAGAIILNTDSSKILLIRGHHSKKWGVPKGSKDLGESIRETAIREVHEETGIEIEIDKYTVPLKIGKLYLYMIHIDESVKLSPIDSYEIMDIKWICISSLTSMDQSEITTPFQKVIRHLVNTLHKKNHDCE